MEIPPQLISQPTWLFFIKIKIWRESSLLIHFQLPCSMVGRSLQGWLLAMRARTVTRIVLHAVRGFSQGVSILCHGTVVFSSLFRVRMGKGKAGKSWHCIISFSRAWKVLKLKCRSWKATENELRMNRQKIKSWALLLHARKIFVKAHGYFLEPHAITLLEKRVLLALHPTIWGNTMSHFDSTQKQKGYRAFDGHSQQLQRKPPWG